MKHRFDHHMEVLQQRLHALRQQLGAVAGAPPQLREAVQRELATALEEAQVAGEELQEQNEELLRTRQAVEVERQRYRDLFESAPDGYVVTDAQGVIREANRAMAAVLRRRQEFLVGKPLVNYVVLGDRRTLRDCLTQLHQHLSPRGEWEVWLQPHHGAPIPAALTVAVVCDPRGQVTEVRWLLRDITERKAAEDALRQEKARAEAADRAKSEFLATMSHELRTPLGVIIGYEELLLEDTFGPVTPEQRRALRRIGSNAKELLDLIVSLLDLSRLEAGRLPVQWQEVRVHDVLAELQAETQELQAESGLAFQWLLPDPRLSLRTDAAKLKVVLKNLIGNAVKFHAAGVAPLVRVTARRTVGACVVTVADNGIGIADGDQERIFAMFTRLHGREQYAGTGIGLAICRRIAERHGGRIYVESVGGGGSAFHTLLPDKPSARGTPAGR